MNLNDHIKEIEKEFRDKFGVDSMLDETGELVSITDFLASKLREIATATLAACEVEEVKVNADSPDIRERRRAKMYKWYNAAISEQKKKVEDYLKP